MSDRGPLGSRRLLALVWPGQEAAALAGLRALVATARAERACLRLACLRPLPPPRVDHWDRIVANVDREMDRITRATLERFDAAARVFDDVAIECVVRFGVPRREARLEVEAFAPDLVASFESRRRAALAIRLARQAEPSRRATASASAASRATRSPAV
jgi:hypothetical protein